MNASEDVIAAALDRSAACLDEAVECLTFDRFDWALEYAWRGVAEALGALTQGDAEHGELAPLGILPPAGSLAARLPADGGPGASARLVGIMEALRREIDADADVGAFCTAHAARIAPIVFDACLLYDAVAAACDRPGTVVEPERRTPPLDPAEAVARAKAWMMRRRDVLQVLAGSGAWALVACAPSGRDPAPTQAAPASAEAAVPQVPPATVRNVTPISAMQWETSDPFLFCAYHVDHYPAGTAQMGPDASLAGRMLGRDFDERNDWRMYHGEVVPGFPRHPHRGFETVTVVRQGLLDHADSLGAAARYGGGDVQWLTAGGGIQHAEMFPLLRADTDNPLELFQIWLNLPAADKMVPAYFTMLWSEDIPHVEHRDSAGRLTTLTLAAGAYDGHTPPRPPPSSWASRTESDLAIWSLRMEPGAAFELPAVQPGTERSVYVHRGDGASVGDRAVRNLHRVVVDGHGPLRIEAGASEVEILLLQGRPIGEPVARRGPFVMNTQDEIRQAYADYQRTAFGGWPWPANDPVHGAEPRRFARHPDGREETPT